MFADCSAVISTAGDPGENTADHAPPMFRLLDRYPPLTGSSAPNVTFTNCSAVISPALPSRAMFSADVLVIHPPAHVAIAPYWVASRL